MPSVITVTSKNISHKPRVNRNRERFFVDFRRLWKYADVPDKKTNVGAHRWVIHRVANSKGVVV